MQQDERSSFCEAMIKLVKKWWSSWVETKRKNFNDGDSIVMHSNFSGNVEKLEWKYFLCIYTTLANSCVGEQSRRINFRDFNINIVLISY